MAYGKKFKRIVELGAGGFGTVTLVENKETKEKSVIKQIWSPVFQSMSKAKDTAQHEIDLLKELCHPNIVAYKDSFQIGSLVCIEMEYCDAGDLHNFIQKQNGKFLSEGVIFDIFGQLCDAIQYVHHKRILHRDIKPQNIFLTKEHRVKLGDFGISKTLYKTTQVALSHAGTPVYSSPEVLQYKPYNNKSDIWSTGVVLYEMTMLKHPFVEPSKGIDGAIQNILHGEYSMVSMSYTKDHREMIEKMLEKEPRDRPSIDQLFRMYPLKDRLHLQSLTGSDVTDNTETKEDVFDSEGRQTVVPKPANKDAEDLDKLTYFQDESVPVDEYNPTAIPSSQRYFLFEEEDTKSLSTGHLVINIPLVIFILSQIFLVWLLGYFLN